MWTDGRTYGRTDGRTDIFPLYTIRSTFGSRPNNFKTWACASNLTLNLTKTVEIVFVNIKRRHQVQPPNPLATVSRVFSLKALGVTISSQMSVSEHVSTVISSCTKSIYATRTLRSHSMNNKALHDLQIRHHSQTVIRCQYMVGVYNSYRPSASRGTNRTVQKFDIRSDGFTIETA